MNLVPLPVNVRQCNILKLLKMKKLILGVLFILAIATVSFSQSFIIEASMPDTILHPMSIKTFDEDIYVLCNATEKYDTTFGIPYEGTLPYGSYIYVFNKYGNEKYHHLYSTAYTKEYGIEQQCYSLAKMANKFYVDESKIILPFTVYNSFSMCNNNPNILYQNSKPGFIKTDKNTGDTLLFKLCNHDSTDCPISYTELASEIIGEKLMLLYSVTTPNSDSLQIQLAFRDIINFDLLEKKTNYFNSYINNSFFDEEQFIFISIIYDNIEKKASIIKYDTSFNKTIIIENLNLIGLQGWELYKTIKTAPGEYISLFYNHDFITNKRQSTLLKYTSDGTILLNKFFDDVIVSDLAIDYSGNVYGIQQYIGDRYWDAPGFRILLFDDTLGIVSWKEYNAGAESSMSIDSDGNFYIIGSKFWNLTVVKDHISILTTGPENKKNNMPYFEINPNPVGDKFILTMKGEAKQFSVKIFSSSGILSYMKDFENCSNTTIEVKHLNAGIYFINVTDFERNTSTQKIVIK